MNDRWKCGLAVLLAGWLGSAPAWADTEALPKVETQGAVSFVSGGIGADELAALKEARHDYNLQMQFAAKGSGEYLSAVKVEVKNARGETVLDTVANGPLLFARLPTGRYRVSADFAGQSQQRALQLTPGRAKTLYLYW